MPFVRCKKFLGMPLVAGMCVLSFLGLIVGGAGAAGGWVQVMTTGRHPIPLEDRVGLFVFAITFSLLVILSLLGLAGGLTRSYSVTVFYKKFALGHLLLIIAALGLSLFSAIRSNDDATVQRCLGDSPDYLAEQLCAKGVSLMAGLRIGLSALALFAQFGAWIVASNFAYKLDLDSVSRRTMIFPDDSSSNFKIPYLSSKV
ncbi:hypothetical protein AAF712_006461 [Marasmius tenuissimus]|uniref:Tetraspanin family protein n=1 Tax=Marasmius tenuissimus TaxID=585030 RepID=A0ABR2ZZD5_9AGAR